MATDEVLARISDYSEARNGGENYVMKNSLICCLRHCSTSRKVTVSITDGVIRIWTGWIWLRIGTVGGHL